MDQGSALRDRARFVAPTPRDRIERHRLDERYVNARGKLLRVLAPGGYGKTSIMTRWASADDRVVGWVDLEPVDNDPVVMFATLGRAIEVILGAPLDAPGAPADSPEFLSVAVGSIADAGERCNGSVLVLDDVHCLDNSTSLAMIAAVAEHLGPDSTLALVGRGHRPGDAIGRLRLHPGVVDVAIDDLAFDVAETDRSLRMIGVELEARQVADLHARLDGWPAGIRLAGLVLRDGRDPEMIARGELDGATPIIDYLRAEWASRLDPEDLAFLRAAACLDRFTGDLCDQVIGRHNSSATLRHLDRDEMMVIPLDRRDEWFRMHPVLARWLQADLRAEDPERWRELHLRAATCWEEAGDIDLAVHHASTAGDTELTERLVFDHAPKFLTTGRHLTVQAWMSRFPPARMARSGSLTLVAALDALLHDPPQSMMWYRQLERMSSIADAAGDASDGLEWAADLLRATLEPAATDDLLAAGERARAAAPSGPWRPLAALVLGGLRVLAGRPGALTVLDDGALEAQLLETRTLEANCLAVSAVALDPDDQQQATDRARRAYGLLSEHQDDHTPNTAIIVAMHSLVEARAGRRASAIADLESARHLLGRLDTFAPWFNVLARFPLVRACLRLDDRPGARELLRELDHHLRFEPADGWARLHLAALRAHIDATPDWTDPTSSLTAAELRVLQFLPTNLNLADIADELYVSRNTVKSHTAAIYRKLGTTSRNQAVEIARAAGLLDSDRPVRSGR